MVNILNIGFKFYRLDDLMGFNAGNIISYSDIVSPKKTRW
jgi:hypothetical protein